MAKEMGVEILTEEEYFELQGLDLLIIKHPVGLKPLKNNEN